MNAFLVLLLLIVALVLVVGLGALSIYNGFIRSRNLIQESWRQVDVELNRRYDLIPNLVETVRAYAAHERNTLEDVTRLRNQAAALAAQGGTPDEQRAAIEEQLSGAVRNLIVSVEAYPDLKSNANFMELQRELTETEDRIAAGRRFYNANVRNYNTKVESVPSNFVANMFGFKQATYFEANNPAVRQAPTVSFGEISDRGDAPRVSRPEPTNDELNAAPGALPNPQGYQGQLTNQPAPGTFDAPAAGTYAPPPAADTYAPPPAAGSYPPPPAGEIGTDPVEGIANPEPPAR